MYSNLVNSNKANKANIFLEYLWKHNVERKVLGFEFEIKVEKILDYYRGRSRTEYLTLRLVFAD